MVDITQTAANVVTTGSPVIEDVVYGATITAGMVVYKDTADDEWKIADCTTSATTAGADGIGIALNGGADGQPGRIVKSGLVNLGATLVVGTRYYVSEAGAIMPHGDLASNDYVTLLGVATTTSILKMAPIVSGIQVP